MATTRRGGPNTHRGARPVTMSRTLTTIDYTTMTGDQLVARTEDLLAQAKALRAYTPPRTSSAELASRADGPPKR